MEKGEAKRAEPMTVNLQDGLAIRVYSDRRPSNLEIAGIQKGLILINGGMELVEEGAGFGLPIAIFRDKTLFPGSATLRVIQNEPYLVIEKIYEMDTVSMKIFGRSRISDAIYHPVHKVFSVIYLSLGSLRPVLNKVIELRDTAGVKTSFQSTELRGRVTVRYTIHSGYIEVEAKSEMAEGCKKLIMLNEQGAGTFRVCKEGTSTLIDDEIGAWRTIKSHEATLSSSDDRISFTMKRPTDAVFRIGRESVKGKLSWAGFSLSYDVNHPISYTIKVSTRSPAA